MSPELRKLLESIRKDEEKLIRRDFWINILLGGILLFLAMICLEIVT